MRKGVFPCVVLLMTFCLLAASLSKGEAGIPRVERVTVQVRAAQHLPPPVQARMEKSVQAIADQIMLGQFVPEVEKSRRQKESILHEVFDKVLVGYTVASVRILPGEDTSVCVDLIPWSDVIRGISLDIAVEGMPPEVEELVRRDLVGVDSVFDSVLVGLPLAATDWSNGILKRRVNEFMEEHLPEFRADFELETEEIAKARLVVYPRLPVVRTVDLSIRSDTVPNFMLLDRRQTVQDRVNMLVGVPVSFVRRHVVEFCGMFAAILEGYADFRQMGIRARVSMEPAEDLAVMIRSDTQDYRIRLEGMADIGREGTKEDLRLRFHAGRRFSKVDEIFLQTDFFPKDVRVRWALGYARALSSRGEVSLQYDFNADRFQVSARQNLGDDWMLRYEYRWSDQLGEVALRYKLHDFLGVEYVVDPRENWLRLIGNF